MEVLGGTVKVVHFYHVYADGLWEPIVDEHLRAWRRSGLDGSPLMLGIVGAPKNRAAVIKHFRAAKVKFSVCAEVERGWEQVTLDQLHRWAQALGDEEAFILYAHTKCAAYPQDVGDNWRAEMAWYNVVEADKAIAMLESGCHCAGIHWMQGIEGQPHFYGGNYWWVRASAARLLSSCPNESRYSAELWVGSLMHVLPGFRPGVLAVGFIGEGAPQAI
jgi:hypothetical protein